MNQLPISVKVAQRSVSVVVDASFAFSPLGLLTTMRLARVAHVWLPRALRSILDNDALYRRQPGQLGAYWLPPASREEILERMAAALIPWQQAWTYGRLSTQVHWIGDARYESVMPDRGDGTMLPRFEACCAALDSRLTLRQAPPSSALDDCARDSLALACALQPEPVVIIAACPDRDEEPAICGYLAIADIEARRLSHPAAAPLFRDLGLAEALMPVIATEQSVALLHLVAPGALALPDSWSDDDWSLEEMPDEGEGLRPYIWDGALVLWQPVGLAS